MNKNLKELRDWFRKEYSGLVQGFETGKIKEEDVQIYLDNAPGYFAVIDLAKKNAVEKARLEHYKEVVNNKQAPATKLLDKAREELQLVYEEYRMTESGNALDKLKGIRKYNKLKKLEKRINQLTTTIEQLEKLEAEQINKRKPGRPKKNQPEEPELDDDFEDEEEE